MKSRVLIASEPSGDRAALSVELATADYEVTLALDGDAAMKFIATGRIDLVVTDSSLVVEGGVSLVQHLRASWPSLPVIALRGAADLAAAVASARAGVERCLTLPVERGVLLAAVEKALGIRALTDEPSSVRKRVPGLSAASFRGLVGTSPSMQKIYNDAQRVAASRATVLITGESGTGQGELARAIHAMSPRADKPLVDLHCAALAESVLESELFGHEKGSFTGADRRRVGRFELADGGTLFLDEVGEIPPSIQVKLLKVLQERTLERVGGNEPVRVDVRLIAATNRDLSADMKSGRFREDLYYRLNVVNIEMPPLRVRGTDVLLLAQHFLQKFAAENRKTVEGFTERAQNRLLAARWEGNVRALENAIERAVVMCHSARIDEPDIPIEASLEPRGELRVPGASMQELERYAILKTLEAVNGSTSRAAEILGIGTRTIQYRLQAYGMARNRSGAFLIDRLAKAPVEAPDSYSSISRRA